MPAVPHWCAASYRCAGLQAGTAPYAEQYYRTLEVLVTAAGHQKGTLHDTVHSVVE